MFYLRSPEYCRKLNTEFECESIHKISFSLILCTNMTKETMAKGSYVLEVRTYAMHSVSEMYSTLKSDLKIP